MYTALFVFLEWVVNLLYTVVWFIIKSPHFLLSPLSHHTREQNVSSTDFFSVFVNRLELSYLMQKYRFSKKCKQSVSSLLGLFFRLHTLN